MQPIYANIGNAYGHWRAGKDRDLQQNRLAYAPEGSPKNALAGGGDVASRLMADLQRDFDLSPAQAAGIVGNLAHESGGFETLQEINPIVEGSRGGYGYAQWTGPRRRQFEAWSEANGLDPSSYEANYGFLRHELTATPEGRVLDDLRSAEDPRSAATVFSRQFLRPGIPHMSNRLALADQYYKG